MPLLTVTRNDLASLRSIVERATDHFASLPDDDEPFDNPVPIPPHKVEAAPPPLSSPSQPAPQPDPIMSRVLRLADGEIDDAWLDPNFRPDINNDQLLRIVESACHRYFIARTAARPNHPLDRT